MLSDLQRLWDHDWKDSRRVHLILCGSAVSFMVGEVLAQKSPTLEPVLVAANGATRGVRDAGIKTVTLKDLFAESAA